MQKITKRVVDGALPRGARYYLWDAELKGFGMMVMPSGVKSYVLQYRTAQGRRRRATLGAHGVLTTEQARAKARQWLLEISGGADPLATRSEVRQSLTVGEMLERYLASARFDGLAETTKRVDRGRVHRHLIPTLGKMDLKTLTAEDVRRSHGEIRDGKTAVMERTGTRGLARVRGGEGAARMAVRILRAAINWAIAEGYCSENPALKVKTSPTGTREAIVETSADYERLFRALDRLEGELRIRRPAADAIRVIALTGARRGEIAGLRWRHVDLRARRITLPPAAHKAGKHTGKPRIIGLPAAACALIERQPEGEPDAFVFQPAKGDGPIDLAHPWEKVRAAADLPGLGLHGLRHSLASHMAMSGAQAAEIMATLGHSQLATSQRYVHFAQDARVALAERAAAPIAAAMEGAPTADVVPIK